MALDPVANGDQPRRHIADHHGNKERGDPAGPLFQQLSVLVFKGPDAPDAASEDHREPLRVHGAPNAAFRRGLLGRRYRELGVPVGAKHLVDLQVFPGIKALYLGPQHRLEPLGIKQGDGRDAVSAVFQALPGFFCVIPQGGNGSQPGDDNSSVFAHPISLPYLLVSFYMAMPPSTRRTSPVT